MDHIENIHNLHVLKFSTSNENKYKTYDCVSLNDKECDESKTHNSYNKYTESIKARSISDNLSETRLPTRKTKLGTKAIRRVFNKSFLNMPHHKRSKSFQDLKQKISLNGLGFSNKNRHNSQFTIRSSIFQHFLRHKVRKNVDVPNKHKNCQVLFKSKRNKSSTQMRKRNIHKELRRLDFLYNSKSSGDLFGIQSNNFYDPKFCYQLFKRHDTEAIQNCKCNNQSSHRGFKSECNEKYEIEHINNRTRGTYGHTRPVHYNLVDFPCNIQPCDPGLTTDKKCVHKVDTTDLCPCAHEQVSVTPSCFAINKKGAGDSEIISRCALIPKVKIQSDNCIRRNHSKFKRKRHTSTKHRKPKFPLLTCDLSKNGVSLAKSTLKYFLFGLVVIAWSPCVIAIGLYWIITYPLRPEYILNASDVECKNRYNKCGSCYKCGLDFLHYIFKACVRLARRVCYSYNAFLHLLKKQKQPRSVCLKRCLSREFSKHRLSKRRQVKYPNPNNKYTLFYTRHRGWIMKPIRKRRKNFNKDCPCQAIEDEKNTSTASKEKLNKHFENGNGDKDKREYECRCHTNEIQNDKGKTEKRDEECVCHTGETKFNVRAKPTVKHSTAKSIQRTKLQSNIHISKQLLQSNSPDQKSVEGKLPRKLFHEKNDRESSPIREFFPNKLTKSIREPIQDTFKSFTIKPNKNVSLKGSLLKYTNTYRPSNAKSLSPHLNRRDPCIIKPYYAVQHLDKIRKVNKSCPHVYKNMIQRTTKRPMIYSYIEKEGPIKEGFQKKESKGQKRSGRQRLCSWFKTVQQNVRNVINDVEGETWKCDICDDMFVYTLTRRPCFWIYRYCPSFYPYFLMFYKFYENVVNAMMFIVSACIWVPLLCWCYFCYTLFCKCIF